MNEFQLKYGTNPNQKPARIYMADGSDLPVQIITYQADTLLNPGKVASTFWMRSTPGSWCAT